jgi:hypothetical protein
MRGWTGWLISAFAAVTAACSNSSGSEHGSPTTEPRGSHTTQARQGSPTTEPGQDLVGRWRWQLGCDDLVRTFANADLSEFAAEWIVGAGFRDGPVKKVASDSLPCRGAAGPFERTTEFTGTGGFIERLEGEVVCDCTYELVDKDTFVIPGDPGDPTITLDYTIDGKVISFKITLPEPCTTKVCRSQKAFAYETFGLGTWRRATP